MKFPQKIETHSVIGAPLCEQAGQTVIDYTKFDFSMKGEGFPTEIFNLYDPTLYNDKGFSRYANGFKADINVLKNPDGSIYPQISIIQWKNSYSIWDGQKRKGTSGLPLLTNQALNAKQKAQVKKIISIFGDALKQMNKENPNNQTFDACMKFFGISKQQNSNFEQDQETSI